MRRLSGFPNQIVPFWNIFAGFVCLPWRKADIMRDEQRNPLFTPAASAAAVTLRCKQAPLETPPSSAARTNPSAECA
jgi:hypothetical protein